MDIGVLLIAITVSLSSAIIGVFLVIRKMAMMTDAISHTVLLGIVLAFLIVPNLNSPFLILGAVIMGLITVFLTEVLINNHKISEDAATGIVFPLLFSLAIIIISLNLSHIHLDSDSVFLGQLEFAGIKQLKLFGTNIGPVSFYVSLLVLIINVLFIKIFFKELKIVSFDANFAKVLGFSPIIIHYSLMALVSLTAVTAFETVGSILVVALMVGPAITAMLFTKDLKMTIIWAAIIALINASVGYLMAIIVDVSIASVIATQTLITFLLVLFFHKRGIINKLIQRSKQKEEFNFIVFLKHLANHLNTDDRDEELNIDYIHNHLNWPTKFINRHIKKAQALNYLKISNKLLIITSAGIKYQNDFLNNINKED